MKRTAYHILLLLLIAASGYAQRVDFSVVFVPEESGNNITRISSAGDYVCLPVVKRSAKGVSWNSNRILGISPDGTHLAYISNRNNATNIFLTDLGKQSGSVQRTKRQGVQDFTFSSDGKYICFSEIRGKECQLFQTDAQSGYVCRQITNGAKDYSPVYSSDMTQVFFAREEKKGFSVFYLNCYEFFVFSFSSRFHHFSNNYIGDSGVSSLASALESNSSLTLLILENNTFFSFHLTPTLS